MQFPVVLHGVLERAESQGYSDIISWQSHGRAFCLRDKERFEQELMPKYFVEQTKFASFQRQLNLYGFVRVTGKGPDSGAYHHMNFVRGRPDLAVHIKRKQPLKEGPDFYGMPPVESLDTRDSSELPGMPHQPGYDMNQKNHEARSEGEELSLNPVARSTRRRRKVKKQHSVTNKTCFPSTLHYVLEKAESKHYSHVISWQPHGRAFCIHDKKRFERDIMPKYFELQSSFASFRRQLNLYGFHRITRIGPDRGAYYHDLFLRGRPDLLAQMKRKQSLGQAPNYDDVPLPIAAGGATPMLAPAPMDYSSLLVPSPTLQEKSKSEGYVTYPMEYRMTLLPYDSSLYPLAFQVLPGADDLNLKVPPTTLPLYMPEREPVWDKGLEEGEEEKKEEKVVDKEPPRKKNRRTVSFDDARELSSFDKLLPVNESAEMAFFLQDIDLEGISDNDSEEGEAKTSLLSRTSFQGRCTHFEFTKRRQTM